MSWMHEIIEQLATKLLAAGHNPSRVLILKTRALGEEERAIITMQKMSSGEQLP